MKILSVEIKLNNEFHLLKSLKLVNYSLFNEFLDNKTISLHLWKSFYNNSKKLDIVFQGIVENTKIEEIIKHSAYFNETIEAKISFTDKTIITGFFLVKTYQRMAMPNEFEKYKINIISNGEVAISKHVN